MSVKEIQEKIVSNVRNWQKVENESIASTGRVMQETNNPLVRLVMEIIQRDSQMHYWVQEWIADSLESKTVSLAPQELEQVWELIEHHIAIEQRAVNSAQQSLDALAGMKGRGMLLQQYLLNYLLMDEQKHADLLNRLEIIKKGMHPYA